MAKRTIYLSEEQEAVYQQAKKLAESSGKTISGIVTDGLENYVLQEEMRRKGMEEIALWIGVTSGRVGSRGKKIKFIGKFVAEGTLETGQHEKRVQTLYRTRKEKYLLYWVDVCPEEEVSNYKVFENIGEIEEIRIANSIAEAIRNEDGLEEFLDI